MTLPSIVGLLVQPAASLTLAVTVLTGASRALSGAVPTRVETNCAKASVTATATAAAASYATSDNTELVASPAALSHLCLVVIPRATGNTGTTATTTALRDAILCNTRSLGWVPLTPQFFVGLFPIFINFFKVTFELALLSSLVGAVLCLGSVEFFV